MDLTLKGLPLKNKGNGRLGAASIDQGKGADMGFISHFLEANAIFRKVTENYDHNLHLSPEGQYVVMLDREIENSCVENPIFSGGAFLIGAGIVEDRESTTKKLVRFFLLNFKNRKCRFMRFLSSKCFEICK